MFLQTKQIYTGGGINQSSGLVGRPCPLSHHSCLCPGCGALPPPPPPPLHQLWKSSDSWLTHFNSTPGENTRVFSAWWIKCINTQANVTSSRAGWGQGDLLVAVDRAPTHPGPCGVSRVPGCSPRAAWAGSGNGSERAREEQNGETATSPWVSNFHPNPSLTSSADEHSGPWLWSFRIFLSLSGLVPTCCTLGKGKR